MAEYHVLLEESVAEARLLGAKTAVMPLWVAEALVHNRKNIAERLARAIAEFMQQARGRPGDGDDRVIYGKIMAIKALRMATGYSLRDAKDAIEDELKKLGYPKCRSDVDDPDGADLHP